MRCDKNGVAVRFNERGEHVYMGDRFKCPGCGSEVVLTNDNSFYDEGAKRELPDDLWMNADRGYVFTKL